MFEYILKTKGGKNRALVSKRWAGDKEGGDTGNGV